MVVIIIVVVGMAVLFCTTYSSADDGCHFIYLFNFRWFHGNISREDAEKMLQPYRNGQYIVRESQNYKGDYTLCVT